MTLCHQLFEDIIINKMSSIVIVFDMSIASLEPVKLAHAQKLALKYCAVHWMQIV